jgi:segregation and condensation protein B
LLDRNWIRGVGHRDVPGKPAMFGTTKEFLDYFGLKKLEDLPTLAEIKEMPELSPQTDLLDSLEADARGVDAVLSGADEDVAPSATVTPISAAAEFAGDTAEDDAAEDDAAADDADLVGPDLIDAGESENDSARAKPEAADETDEDSVRSAEIIPLRAVEDER